MNNKTLCATLLTLMMLAAPTTNASDTITGTSYIDDSTPIVEQEREPEMWAMCSVAFIIAHVLDTSYPPKDDAWNAVHTAVSIATTMSSFVRMDAYPAVANLSRAELKYMIHVSEQQAQQDFHAANEFLDTQRSIFGNSTVRFNLLATALVCEDNRDGLAAHLKSYRLLQERLSDPEQ